MCAAVVFGAMAGVLGGTLMAEGRDKLRAMAFGTPELLASASAKDLGLGGSYLVWTNESGEFCIPEGTVKSMHLASKEISTLFSECETPFNVVANSGFVYFTNWDTDQIVRLPITGGTETILATGDGLVYHRALAQDSTVIDCQLRNRH
jgi:hypothetical protein